MKKSIDARGLPCPQPVILCRKALAEGGIDEISVTVDNEAAKENVQRFLKSAGAPSCAVHSAGGAHTISCAVTPAMVEKARQAAAPGCETQPAPPEEKALAGKTVFVSADQIGRGDETLGKLLVRGFLYTLSELQRPPKTLVLMNAGVRLAAEREDTIEILKALSAKGVEILVCGTCLDYFHLKENLKAGRVSNMLEITERFLAASDVVTIA